RCARPSITQSATRNRGRESNNVWLPPFQWTMKLNTAPAAFSPCLEPVLTVYGSQIVGFHWGREKLRLRRWCRGSLTRRGIACGPQGPQAQDREVALLGSRRGEGSWNEMERDARGRKCAHWSSLALPSYWRS